MSHPGLTEAAQCPGLVPRRLQGDAQQICGTVRARFAFLTELNAHEQTLLNDQTAHREQPLFDQLRTVARTHAEEMPR